MWARKQGWRWLAGLLALAFSACAILLSGSSGARAAGVGLTTPTTTTAPSTTTAPGPVTTGTPPATTAPSTTGTGTATTPAPSGPEQVQVKVGSTPVAGPLPAGFLGFSVEFSALQAYLGRNPNALNPVFLQLLSGIDQDQAPILRVGGDSTDDSWVQLPGVIPPLAVDYTITNDWIATVHALVRQTDARLILGVNLAADDPQLAGVEARALVNGIGSQYIEDLEVGNEPDLYLHYPWYYLDNGTEFTRRTETYSFRDYIANLAQWRGLLPSHPLAVGALATINWLGSLDPVAATDPDVSMVTVHRYPLSHCGVSPSSPEYPTLSNLLDSASTEGLAATLAPYAQALHAEGLNFRVDELNSASCEGAPGVSNTFGSALWMLNELFDMAAAGVDGINVHTLPGSYYAPFTFNDVNGHWTADVRPLYYGMLLFAAAFPPGADLLDVNVANTSTTDDVKVYATDSARGTLRTTVINEDPSRAADVQLQLPTAASRLTEETLTAPSLSATSGVRLGGRSFASPTASGELPAPSQVQVSGASGAFTLTVPAGSAVMLTGGG